MILNLGCASHPIAGAVNVDRVLLPTSQLVFDATRPFPLRTTSVDSIVCRQMMQYLPPPSIVPFINEVWRVLTPGGSFDAFVPRALTPQAHCAPDTQSFYTLATFEYFVDGHPRCVFERQFNGFIGHFTALTMDVCNWASQPTHDGEWLHVVLVRAQ
jgi:SAM-dependent methyltransferase